MNLTVLVFSAVLFFVLSPGILVTFPKNGNKMTVAAVHALIFAVVFHFSHKFVWHISTESFQEGVVKKGQKGPKVDCNKVKPCKKGMYHPDSFAVESECYCKPR